MGFSSHRGTGMVCCRPISGVHPNFEALKQCQFKVGPASQTAGQHYSILSWYLGMDISQKTPSKVMKIKWNESGFRPPLCTYRLNWARRTSWGWWDDWDDTVFQTQDSKFEPWRSEAEHATSRSRRLPTILTFTRGWGRNTFCFFQTAETGNRTPNSGVKGSGANHYPRAPAQQSHLRNAVTSQRSSFLEIGGEKAYSVTTKQLPPLVHELKAENLVIGTISWGKFSHIFPKTTLSPLSIDVW